ncbi:MAG: gluconeogenesis factor YvcK family protein [Coriobacteriia bacterium]|nr:gluconeogenesis factor YvcK family protein [Coriobacteriia bacterium]
MSVGTGRAAVAIGGGTGLPQVLRSLVDLDFATSAIVTMADDGGSSGVLRRQLGILPPGDVRNCLAALASDEDSAMARVFQYRFPEGEGLAGHSLGNLILAALTDITGDFAEAVVVASGYLHARGTVLPSTLLNVELHGIDRAGVEISGQALLAANPTAVDRVFLEPASPPAYPPALEAIEDADVVVVGPGSLYTSVIPNLLVAGIADALRSSHAHRAYICNVANLRGETSGLDAADHVEALMAHGLAGAIDTVIVHAGACAPDVVCDYDYDVEPVVAGSRQVERIEALGVRAVMADLADPGDPARHARDALARVLEEVLA